jgi:hypothetical protein
MRVLKSVFILTAFYVVTGCSMKQMSSQNERIQKVENGLIEASQMAESIGLIVDIKRTDSLPKLNILDRMRVYNIPGVSIAVFITNAIAVNKYFGWYYNKVDDFGKYFDDWHEKNPKSKNWS